MLAAPRSARPATARAFADSRASCDSSGLRPFALSVTDVCICWRWEYASLLREHYLSAVSGPAPVPFTAADGAAARLQQETVFWQSIMGSTNAADFEAYLGQFPDGVYRALVANRLAELRPAPGDPDRTRPAEPESVFRDCAGCPEMVVAPAGRFRMGCVSGRNCSNNELPPVHEVSVGSFALSKYDVR